MRLINTGVGELSDRLSILSLKLHYLGDRDHWVTERSTILTKLSARTIGAPWLNCYAELSAVNAAIWRGEDELRVYRSSLSTHPPAAVMESIVAIACNLQAWNDRRHALIQQINKDAGDPAGHEKATT